MARPLPDSIQRILSLKAAEGGFNTAYFWLADLDEKVDPSSSVDWLFKARVHDTTGIADQRIAEMYLNGSLGKIDSTVAYGCMKLVFSKKLKKRMLAMRINSPNLDTTKACEQAQ
jgi:succinate dehydrogenase/fumarate reductase flavoprotein subunit